MPNSRAINLWITLVSLDNVALGNFHMTYNIKILLCRFRMRWFNTSIPTATRASTRARAIARASTRIVVNQIVVNTVSNAFEHNEPAEEVASLPGTRCEHHLLCLLLRANTRGAQTHIPAGPAERRLDRAGRALWRSAFLRSLCRAFPSLRTFGFLLSISHTLFILEYQSTVGIIIPTFSPSH